MYVDDMTLGEAQDVERQLLAVTPGGYGDGGYHGRDGVEQHRWDLEDVRGRIADLEGER
jgi:hypothetical protein